MEKMSIQKLALAMFGLAYGGLIFSGEASQAKRPKLSTSAFQQELGVAVIEREQRVQGYQQEEIARQQAELTSFFAAGQKVTADALKAQDAQHQQAIAALSKENERLRKENSEPVVVHLSSTKKPGTLVIDKKEHRVQHFPKKKKAGEITSFLSNLSSSKRAEKARCKRMQECARAQKLKELDLQNEACRREWDAQGGSTYFVTPPTTLQRQSK